MISEISAHVKTIKQMEMDECDRQFMLAIEYSNIALAFLINKHKTCFLRYIKKSWLIQPNVNKVQSRFYLMRHMTPLLFLLTKVKARLIKLLSN